MEEVKRIPTPCVGLCGLMDNKCKGCKRTLEEIRGWRKFTDEERQQIIEELKTR